MEPIRPVNETLGVKMGREGWNGWLEFSRRLSLLVSLEELAAEIAHRSVELLDVLFCRVLIIQANQALECVAGYDRRLGSISADLIKPVPASTQWVYQRSLTQPAQPFSVRSGTSLSSNERWALGLPAEGALGLAPMYLNGEPVGLLIFGQENGIVNQPTLESQAQPVSYLAELSAAAIYRVILNRRLQANRLETVQALARVLEGRDIYTASQGQRMMDMAERIALLLGCPAGDLEAIRWAALLHDIGMISVSDELLHRAGSLMPEEWLILRKHAQIGAEMVSTVSNLAAVAELIHFHHERYDGKGYPRGVSGEHIPLGARILAVIDVYSVMIDGRAYRPHSTHAEAVEEIRRCSGKNFDPRVVEAFLTLYP